MATITLAANRFGLGAGPAEAAARGDPESWVLEQLAPAPPPAPVAALAPSEALLAAFRERRSRRGRGRERAPGGRRRGLRETLLPAYLAQVHARVSAAVASPRPVHERLVHFWSNHFAVSADKPPLLGIAGALENEAVRPHVHGRFADLLIAAVQHPALLLYLDNPRSVAPDAPLARRLAARAARRGRELGMNENLAREVLELHTLGVGGGYTQTDVRELARVLTGWSLGGGPGPLAEGEPGRFEFRENLHDPGTKRVLGRRYRADGLAEGRRVLEDLAAHPATARHLARKLVVHFVADTPPAGVVDRLAGRYLETGGDLSAVYQRLFTEPAAWVPEPAKFRTPNDLLLATLRLLQRSPGTARVLLGYFESLGQRPWVPGSPAGWPDTRSHWANGEALLRRIEWAAAIAARVPIERDPLRLAETALGAALPADLGRQIARAPAPAEGLGMLLASPAFQWR